MTQHLDGQEYIAIPEQGSWQDANQKGLVDGVNTLLLLALLVCGQLFSVYKFGYGLHRLTSHEPFFFL